MPLVLSTAEKLEEDAARLPIATIVSLLQDSLGQRIIAYLAGLNDAKQIGRYRKPGGPRPTTQVELRLREGYKVVCMIRDTYDAETAKAWLFGTNSHLDDQAPIGMLRAGKTPEDFIPVIHTARQFASAYP